MTHDLQMWSYTYVTEMRCVTHGKVVTYYTFYIHATCDTRVLFGIWHAGCKWHPTRGIGNVWHVPRLWHTTRTMNNLWNWQRPFEKRCCCIHLKPRSNRCSYRLSSLVTPNCVRTDCWRSLLACYRYLCTCRWNHWWNWPIDLWLKLCNG